MPGRKSFGLLITALGLVATAAVGARAGKRTNGEDVALRLLVKAFERTSPRNVVAVMRMSLDNPAERQTVQVQIAEDGRQRVEVIEPLQRAGTVILELGDVSEVYNPDKHTLSIGRSMSADLFEPSERSKLVHRNYSLKMTHGVEIAGRQVVRIDATSRHADIGGASIFIDPASYFVMRVDSVTAEGKATKRFTTDSVSYPAELPSETFDLKGVNATTVRENDPHPVTDVAAAAREVGFRPMRPRALPYGFVIRRTYIRLEPAKSISFNLSDGLAAASLFEFDFKHCPRSVRTSIESAMRSRPEDYVRSGNVVVGIVSNLAPKARRKLLESFRPTHGTAELEPYMNDAENMLNDGKQPHFSPTPGTIRVRACVTRYRTIQRNLVRVG